MNEKDSESRVFRQAAVSPFNAFDCGGEALDGREKLSRVPAILFFPIALVVELYYQGVDTMRDHFIRRNQP